MADTLPSDSDDDWLESAAAVGFAKVSLKTLTRADAAGADCGLRRIGRKLVFNRALLSKWLLAQKSPTVAATAPNLRVAHPAR